MIQIRSYMKSSNFIMNMYIQVYIHLNISFSLKVLNVYLVLYSPNIYD